jgi:YHS domain-containing protein
MNLRGSDRLRVLMMGAVAAGVFGTQPLVRAAGPTSVSTNSNKPTGAAPAKPAAPRLLSVPETDGEMIRLVSETESLAAATPQKKSEVMKQLELLYEKDGREMPDLNTDIRPVPNNPAKPGTPGSPATAPAAPRTAAVPAAPSAPFKASGGIRTQQQAPGQIAPQATAPAVTPPKSKYPVLSFFKKLIPGSKDPRPSEAPSEYRPDVAPVPPGIASNSAPARSIPPNRSAAIPPAINPDLPPLDSQPRIPFVTVAERQPDAFPKPLADLGDIPPSPDFDFPLANANSGLLSPNLDATPAELPALEELPAAPSVADAADPFTEMSEAEADKTLELNPFTGLTLNSDAGSAAAVPENKLVPPLSVPTAIDPFEDELKDMGILPPADQPIAETPKQLTPLDAPTFDGIEDQATREKMKKIHERGSMKGLKGFCPVTLRDQRELTDAKPEFHSTFRGQKFHFASADAKLQFDEEPARYAPAAYGADVVALTRDKDVVEGSLDYAAWFKGRLYLFGNQETHDTFVADPSQFATPVGIE